MNGIPDRFEGTNPDPVTAGSDLEVCFEDPALVGQTVTVCISNGGDLTDDLDIEIEDNGRGYADWPVPVTGWPLVRLSHDSSKDHTVAVTS